MIDRRGNSVQDKEEIDRNILDRWKYDLDDEDVEDIYEIDNYEIQNMRYRAAISHAQGQITRRAQMDASSSRNQPEASATSSIPARETTSNA